MSFVCSQDKFFQPDELFHIDNMDSHNKEFTLYFKGREKSVLARGEDNNYINDYPKDLYIYNYSTKSSGNTGKSYSCKKYFAFEGNHS